MTYINPLPKALLELAFDRAITLDSALNTLSNRKPADDTANQLIKASVKALERVRNKCEQLITECEQLGPRDMLRQEALEKEGRLYNTFLEFLESQLVPLLERVYSAHTPSEVVLPIRRITSKLLPKSDILIASTPEINYRFGQIGDIIRANFANIGCTDILDDNNIQPSLWLLLVCAMPPSGILTHTWISHELGHGLFEIRNLNNQIIPLISIKEDEFNKLVDEYAALKVQDSEGSGGSVSQPRQRRLDEYFHRSVIELKLKAIIDTVIQNWVKEFACDVIGMCLFGPAFLLSHLYFFIPLQKLDDAHSTHPSPRMRFKFCLNSMLGTDTGLGYRQVASVPLAKQLASWKQMILEKMPKSQDKILQVAYQSVRPVLPRILSVCKRETGQLQYNLRSFERDIPALCERLSQALPPNEYYDVDSKEIKSVGMISILNAAWAFHLKWLIPQPNLLELVPIEKYRQRFSGLIQKSIEMAELKQDWPQA